MRPGEGVNEDVGRFHVRNAAEQRERGTDNLGIVILCGLTEQRHQIRVALVREEPQRRDPPPVGARTARGGRLLHEPIETVVGRGRSREDFNRGRSLGQRGRRPQHRHLVETRREASKLLDLQLGQRAAGFDAPHRGHGLIHDHPVDPSTSARDEQIDRQRGPQPDEGQHQRWECGGQDRRKRGHPSEGQRHRCAAATILEQNAPGQRIRCIAVHMQNGAVRVHQHVCRPSGLPPPEPTAARATAVADSQRRREATP